MKSIIQQCAARATSTALAAAEKQFLDRIQETDERLGAMTQMNNSLVEQMDLLERRRDSSSKVPCGQDQFVTSDSHQVSYDIVKLCTLPDGSLDPCKALQLIMGGSSVSESNVHITIGK